MGSCKKRIFHRAYFEVGPDESELLIRILADILAMHPGGAEISLAIRVDVCDPVVSVLLDGIRAEDLKVACDPEKGYLV